MTVMLFKKTRKKPPTLVWDFWPSLYNPKEKFFEYVLFFTENFLYVTIILFFHANLILQIPHAVAMRELVVTHTALGQNATLKAAHVEQQIRIVLAVHRHEAVRPFDRRHRPGQTIL